MEPGKPPASRRVGRDGGKGCATQPVYAREPADADNADDLIVTYLYDQAVKPSLAEMTVAGWRRSPRD